MSRTQNRELQRRLGKCVNKYDELNDCTRNALQVNPAPVVAAELGLAHCQVMRVEGGGASGALAVRAGVMHILAGLARRVLVVGDTASHLASEDVRLIYAFSFDADVDGLAGATSASLYALSMVEHMAIHGTTEEQMATVAVKNRDNARHNPNAHEPMQIGVEDVLASPVVSTPYKLLDCSLLSDGAAAVVLSRRQAGCADGADARSWTPMAASRRCLLFISSNAWRIDVARSPGSVPLTLELHYEHPLGGLARYFHGLEEGRAIASRCPVCGRTWFPPKLRCPDHVDAISWVELSGAGTVMSVTRTSSVLPFTEGRQERTFVLVGIDGADNLAFGQLATGQEAGIGARVRLAMAPGSWPHPAQAAWFTPSISPSAD